MSKYAELIARLEKATGPDRELDVAICEATGDYSRRSYSEWCGIQPKGSRPTITDFLNARLSTRYTASLDAALTLVPEGCVVRLHLNMQPYPSIVHIERTKKYGAIESVSSFSQGPAIALCIAALKAREAIP